MQLENLTEKYIQGYLYGYYTYTVTKRSLILFILSVREFLIREAI